MGHAITEEGFQGDLPAQTRRQQRILGVDHVELLLSKKEIALRYGVSVRTVTQWMRRRILPYIKMSHKVVRFDPRKCDIALEIFETKSLFDAEIKTTLAKRTQARQP